jgi:hypothetical protein
MLGGDASAKVASYVLVAADAGTAISMSNGSATTITVNTGLFAAGDIVTIINLGAGVCTITAGTATVTTSGSLALAQNQGGVLRFTSASAAIFFQFATPASGDIEGVTAGTGISGGGTSGTVTITNSMATAIDAKGDLVVGTGADTFARLAVGTNGYTLVADSAETTGLKWQAAAAGGGITLISTTNFSSGSATLSITSIPTTYKKLYLMWHAFYPSSNAASITMRFNSDTGNNYVATTNSGNVSFGTSLGLNNWTVPNNSSNIAYRALAFIELPNYTSTANGKFVRHTFTSIFDADTANNSAYSASGLYIGTSAITSISLITGSGNWSGGVAYLYGEN